MWYRELVTCPTCGGSGKVDGNFYVVSTFKLKPRPPRMCYTCDGRGEIVVEYKEGKGVR
jgi:DnaJ-class molecular chaperone